MNQLVSETSRADLLEQTAAQYRKTRADRASRADRRRLLSIEEARDRRETFDWPATAAPAPTFTGTRVFHDYPLQDLVDYIDWTPFFLAWELRGAYPAILDNPTYGREARTLFRDAQNLLDKIISLKAFTASAVVGLYPANSIGDDVQLYTDEHPRQRPHHLPLPPPAGRQDRPARQHPQEQLLPRRLHRPPRLRRPRPHRRIRRNRRTRRRPVRRRPRTGPRRLRRDHVQGPRRPPRRSLRRAAARARPPRTLGLRPRRA